MELSKDREIAVEGGGSAPELRSNPLFPNYIELEDRASSTPGELAG
jgi:hypothetical protein